MKMNKHFLIKTKVLGCDQGNKHLTVETNLQYDSDNCDADGIQTNA